MPYLKIHLHARNPLENYHYSHAYLGCKAVKYGKAYGPDDLEWTKKIEHVTCPTCLKELIHHRERPSSRGHYARSEGGPLYWERQQQLRQRLNVVQAEYDRWYAERVEINKKEREARKRRVAEKRVKDFLEGWVETGPRDPAPDKYTSELAFREHDYVGDDVALDPRILKEATMRNRGEVDCDEFTLARRMAHGRNLENEVLWFPMPGFPNNTIWKAGYRELDEYWPWDD